jgi:hypothetical protein
MYPFFTQITKDIRFKPNHQMYPYNKSQGISNCFVNKNQAINYVKLSQINNVSLNHKRYPRIIPHIEKK